MGMDSGKATGRWFTASVGSAGSEMTLPRTMDPTAGELPGGTRKYVFFAFIARTNYGIYIYIYFERNVQERKISWCDHQELNPQCGSRQPMQPCDSASQA